MKTEYEFQRLWRLEAQKSDSGIARIPLKMGGGITRLDLVVKATNGASANATNPIRDIVTNVRLVLNTGTEIINCSGAELMAMASLRDKIEPPHDEADTANLVQYAVIPIMFGRTIRDQQIGLDLSKNQGAELQITYNAAIVRAVGATGFVSGTTSFAVDAYCTKDGSAPNYQARIIPIKVKNNVATTVTEERIPMKTGAPLVSVLLYAHRSAYLSDSLVDEVTLEELGQHRVYVRSVFSALQNERPLLAGTVIDAWAQVYMAPGRMGEEPLKSFGQTDCQLKIRELATSGVYSVLCECIEPN